MRNKFIDNLGYDDLNLCLALSGFLMDLGMNSADFLNEFIGDELNENFCGYCEDHRDNCDCVESREYERDDYEPEYYDDRKKTSNPVDKTDNTRN